MTPPSPPLVSFQNVGLKFKSGPTLFHNLTLELQEKEFYFLTGASGAGKSTLLRMIYMDQPPTSGNIHIFGKSLKTMTANDAAMLRRKIGIVFQDFRLVPHLTALENVALPLKIQGIHDRRREKEAIELLQWVGLKSVIHEPPHKMSGGQQQRVAIARAVISRPRLLLADEPTGNVDDQVAMRLLYLFEELYKSGTTIVVATHNQFLSDALPYGELVLEQQAISIKNKPMTDTSEEAPHDA